MIWPSQVARDVDQLTTTQYGLPSASLMEEAGLAVARWAMELWKPGLRILIAAGSGNNGGDALVAACHLVEAGFDPQVLVVAEQANETTERRQQRLRYEALGRSCLNFRTASDLAAFAPSPLLLIDGLLGLGPTAPLREGPIKDCLRALAALKASVVLAIDLPSGLQADVWDGERAVLSATHTLTFGAVKPLHRLEPARSDCGLVRVMPLAFHPEAIHSALQKSGFAIDADRDVLPRGSPWKDLPADAHKYTRGHVLVIGGSAGKLGAPLFSAMAAQRAGAGWVSVALLDSHHQPDLPRSLTYESFADEAQLLHFVRDRKVKALVIGPGTMLNPLTPSLLQALMELQKERSIGLVFDAGALKQWSPLAQGLRFDPTRTLLTPHPGEWRAIDAQHEDLKSLKDLAKAWAFCETFGVSVFYKTATPFTLSTWGSPRLLLNNDGSRALGKAGSGDVLAGAAAAFLCAGWSATLAANAAQRAVALASRRAEAAWGPDGLGPEEWIAGLGQALQEE